MSCKCEEGTWGVENKSPICKHPVYTEGVLCLNCAHDRACHEPESSIPPPDGHTTKGKVS